jgi:hypothetical protein
MSNSNLLDCITGSFLLLECGMAKEALAAFEATKIKEPNRFNGFLGAALAAEKLRDGRAVRARRYRDQFLVIGFRSRAASLLVFGFAGSAPPALCKAAVKKIASLSVNRLPNLPQSASSFGTAVVETRAASADFR